MVALISHPFRILPNGNVATREEDSDEYLGERLELILTIRPGERLLVPEFGIGDLEFQGLAASALENQIELFGLPVTIIEVVERVTGEGTVDYTVRYDTALAAEDEDDE